MISTKNKTMTSAERKAKVAKLKEEHQDYFDKNSLDPLYIPKMAYRPAGKDELYVSFFPSELEKGQDIYTEFVSINYDSEDPKRTLYLHRYNAHWKQEYELVTSSSGFERHMIPVSELQVINDVTNRKEEEIKAIFDLKDLPNPDDTDPMVKVLTRIAVALEKISNK
jgi:hypothetical protein